MNSVKRLLTLFSLSIVLVGLPITLLTLSTPACATNASPQLSPEARAAWYGTRVIKALDLFRDTAIDANAQTPPLLSTAATAKIVRYHKSAITIIHGVPGGWKSTVLAGLDEATHEIPYREWQILVPYINLIKIELQEVP